MSVGMMKLSVSATLAAIRNLGLQAGYTSEYQEYRITRHGLSREQAEREAYYTSDWQDAVDTAAAIAKRFSITPR